MRAKCKQKKLFGLHRTMLNSYLQEYMWQQEFGEHPLRNLVKQISVFYHHHKNKKDLMIGFDTVNDNI